MGKGFFQSAIFYKPKQKIGFMEYDLDKVLDDYKEFKVAESKRIEKEFDTRIKNSIERGRRAELRTVELYLKKEGLLI